MARLYAVTILAILLPSVASALNPLSARQGGVYVSQPATTTTTTTTAAKSPTPSPTTTAASDHSSSSSSPPTTSITDSESSSASKPAETYIVKVGAAGHKFTPNVTFATKGDIIEFQFYPGDHWVIRGDFDNPCIPYEYVYKDRQGFSSGLQTAPDISNPPRYRVTINDTEPVYYYCGGTNSCVPNHMMGIVNPVGIPPAQGYSSKFTDGCQKPDKTLDEWIDKAKVMDFQLRPGDSWPSEHPSPTPSPIPSPTGSVNQPGTSSPSTHMHGKISVAETVGIVVGIFVALILLGLAIFGWRRRVNIKTSLNKRIEERQQQTAEADANPQAAGIWTLNKYMGAEQGPQYHSPIASAVYGQTPDPMVPPMGTAHGYYPAPGSEPYYYPHMGHQYPQSAPVVRAEMPAQEIQQNSPVELPSSCDPGNSPLPQYEGGRPRFSWAGEESAYRPTKG